MEIFTKTFVICFLIANKIYNFTVYGIMQSIPAYLSSDITTSMRLVFDKCVSWASDSYGETMKLIPNIT